MRHTTFPSAHMSRKKTVRSLLYAHVGLNVQIVCPWLRAILPHTGLKKKLCYTSQLKCVFRLGENMSLVLCRNNLRGQLHGAFQPRLKLCCDYMMKFQPGLKVFLCNRKNLFEKICSECRAENRAEICHLIGP